ncbi:MAG: hypothetical protein WBM02_03095 [bacterium]
MDRRLVIIGILLFSLYFFSTRFSLDGYELEYVLSAMNIYHGNGPALAPGFTGCPGIWPTDGHRLIYPRQNLLQSYLSVPFYAMGALLFGEHPTIEGRGGFWELPWGPLATVSLLNPLLAAWIAVLVGLISKKMGIHPPGHLVMSVLYGVTTMNWHYGALGMEVVQTAVLMTAVWAAICYRQTGKKIWLLVSMIMLPALANTKKISFIFVFPIVVYLAWVLSKQGKKITPFAAVILVTLTGIALMIWLMVVRFHADPELFPHLLRVYFAEKVNIIDLVFALLISPGEGLLIFNPMLWFSLPALPAFFRNNRQEGYLFLGIFIMLMILAQLTPYILIDEEWGPRYFLLILPLVYIMGAKGLLKNRQKISRILFVLVLIISLAIQWLSSMYLGFKMLDIPMMMGISDYMITVFTPSMSQIAITAACFGSYLHCLFTGDSFVLKYRQYSQYTGKGGNYITLYQDLKGLDSPSGGLFTVRWVLSEKGYHEMTPGLTFLIKLIIDILLLGTLGLISIRALKQYRFGEQSITEFVDYPV